MIETLRSGSARLQSVRDNAISKVDSAIWSQFEVGDNWKVGRYSIAGPFTKDEVAAQESARNAHQEAIDDAVQQLTDEDEAVAFALDSANDELSATKGDVAAGRDYVPPSLVGLTPEQAKLVVDDPRFQEWVKNHPDAAKPLLDAAFDAGTVPKDFYGTFLQSYWLRESLEDAGIDASKWDPSKGTEFNSETITKVYEYYGQLFLDHPEMQWAGMANMIGPSFAGGFYDLAAMRDIAKAIKGPAGVMLPDQIEGMTRAIAGMSDEELAYYEQKFLSMQKEIFEDQAPMHEAYLHGGIAEIDRMQRAVLIDDKTQVAWHQIESGAEQHSPQLVAEGNKQLLQREQLEIIDDDYNEMRSHPVTGEAMTWILTTVGTPSIPGAQAYPEVFPTEISVDNSRYAPGETTVETPFPDGNIADRHDRWKLITEDTLPAYQELLASNPEEARQIIGSDFDSRIEDQRISNRSGQVIDRMISDWKVKHQW
ncbi:WXG100 family type VII secretion target [Williamsia limnetica]|uniref:WXG100 family type VII secretion target n=1 Tax=Williamsia limnetica TaxID=882452 RepID=UPI0011B5B62D|nr:WXG100 family type VII secretion target [Williamsia limnetica]